MQKQKTEDRKRGQEVRGSPDTYFNMSEVNAFLGRQRGEGSQPQKQIFAYVFLATTAIPTPSAWADITRRGLKIHSASAIKVAFGITHATNTSPSLIAGLGVRLRQTRGKPLQWASYASMVHHYIVMYHIVVTLDMFGHAFTCHDLVFNFPLAWHFFVKNRGPEQWPSYPAV